MEPVEEIKHYLVDDKKLAILIGAFVIGAVIRFLKDDVKGPSIDPKWRMLLVWVLGVCQFGLNLALQMGWKQAFEYAAISALLAVSGHETIVEWWRNGKELPLPGLMKKPANDNQTNVIEMPQPEPPKNDPPKDEAA